MTFFSQDVFGHRKTFITVEIIRKKKPLVRRNHALFIHPNPLSMQKYATCKCVEFTTQLAIIRTFFFFQTIKTLAF